MEEELNTTTNTSILNTNIDTLNKISKILLVLPSISNSNHRDNGIKAKILEEIKNKCDKNKIILVIATLSGNQPVINYQKDELLKIWTNNVFINKEIELIDIKDINVNEYYGIFLPCFSSIYEEMSDEKNKLALIVSMFHFQKKIICCLGHSVFCLLQVTDYSGKNNNNGKINIFYYILSYYSSLLLCYILYYYFISNR